MVHIEDDPPEVVAAEAKLAACLDALREARTELRALLLARRTGVFALDVHLFEKIMMAGDEVETVSFNESVGEGDNVYLLYLQGVKDDCCEDLVVVFFGPMYSVECARTDGSTNGTWIEYHIGPPAAETQ